MLVWYDQCVDFAMDYLLACSLGQESLRKELIFSEERNTFPYNSSCKKEMVVCWGLDVCQSLWENTQRFKGQGRGYVQRRAFAWKPGGNRPLRRAARQKIPQRPRRGS